jgi:hypothetical protein
MTIAKTFQRTGQFDGDNRDGRRAGTVGVTGPLWAGPLITGSWFIGFLLFRLLRAGAFYAWERLAIARV